MTENLVARLQAVLAQSYTIERELGRGGMAHVYLAQDLQHGRRVAIKLFLPEIASAFGRGRFLREIRTAANLNHPNILSLHDSGEGDDLLYYVMPYVEGETLAQRIHRDGQLPIDDAVAIARQVAGALQYAHDHGVVHRDIKPANILLQNGHAFVADFGIAYALEESGGERLTSAGFALGTPAYMSPEQSLGVGTVDGRADLYSLGCVLYEMLTGDPPFSGRSARAVLARHTVERVPSVRAVRDTVPTALEHAVRKALAKSPVDRFPTARDFIAALTPERLSQKVRLEEETVSHRFRALWMASGAALVILLLTILAARGRDGAPDHALNPDLVAVMPFQIGSGSDPDLVTLAEGLADRVAREFTGNGSPRAVLPSAVRQALAARGFEGESVTEAIAFKVSADVGAGLFLMTDLSRAGDRLQMSARIERAPSRDVVAQASVSAENRQELLPRLDRLVAELLLGAAREPTDRYESLTRLPLSALRRYLTARQAFSRGQFDAAVNGFRDVLRADSTCALAAVGFASAGRFVGDSLRDEGIRKSLPLQHLLPPGDRYLLEALKGPRWPQEPTIPERNVAWRDAAREAPDRSEIYYHLGETLFHDGPWTDVAEVLHAASLAFRQAVSLEPQFLPALGHLLDLAASAGDTAEVRRLGRQYLAIDSTSALAHYHRWRMAVALGDDRARAAVYALIDSLVQEPLERLVNVTQVDGVALEDGWRAARSLWWRTGLRDRRAYTFNKQLEVLLNQGRPDEAASVLNVWRVELPFRARDRLSIVVEALYWGADTAMARRLVAEQAPTLERPLPPDAGAGVYYDVCGGSLWRLSRGELDKIPRAIAALRRIPDPLANPQTTYIRICADILDAQLAAAQNQPDAVVRLERLDSLARTAPPTITWILAAANLTSAKLWERQGSLDRALRATRRRLYITDLGEPRVLVAHSTFLREEGRLAALLGDRRGALRAYRIYLALRANAEPGLAAEVAQVRTSYDSILRESR